MSNLKKTSVNIVQINTAGAIMEFESNINVDKCKINTEYQCLNLKNQPSLLVDRNIFWIALKWTRMELWTEMD